MPEENRGCYYFIHHNIKVDFLTIDFFVSNFSRLYINIDTQRYLLFVETNV